MRLVWTALLCGALSGGGRVPAHAAEPPTVAAPAPAASAQATPALATATLAAPTLAAPTALALQECRLEHPLRLSSIAARCGVLPVAENPAVPAGAKIELYVAVVPALNRRAAAPPLFLLAGGPGQAATDLYVSYAAAFARSNRNHDIVLVDQRGTGRSSPLICGHPDEWQDTREALPELREATRRCLANLGARVRYYTTSVAVADLDQVRAALGYDTIELYGSSYGTRVAELYMRRYPRAVAAVILDGVTYPEQIIGPETPTDGERALDLIVARCEQTPACNSAYPALRTELATLRGRFGAQHQSLEFDDPSSGLPLSFDFNRAVLDAALRFLSYSALEASLLPALIHAAAQGRLAPLASQTVMLARQVDAQLASGMQNTVVCSEDQPGFAGNADRQRLAQTYQGTDQLDGLAEVCGIWPRGPVDPELHRPLHSDTPALLLSGEADPVTPPEDAVRAARGFTHARRLVLAGEGHGQLATGCVPSLMAQFLDQPQAPMLDATCLQRHRPAPFFIGLTGPTP